MEELKITEEQFLAYEDVRESGVCNMMDLRTVSYISGLDRQTIKTIIMNYKVEKGD